MADSKVSGLAAVAAFAATQEFPVNDSGTSRKITGAQLQAAFPNGTLGYVQVTAAQGPFTTLTDLTSLTLTITAAQANGRRLRITGAALFSSSVASDSVLFEIAEGATVIQTGAITLPTTNQSAGAPVIAIVTPTNASHTYKLSALRGSGSGNITMQAAATFPAFILIEDIGT